MTLFPFSQTNVSFDLRICAYLRSRMAYLIFDIIFISGAATDFLFLAGSTSDSQAHGLQSDNENDQSYYSDAPSSSIRGLTAIDKLFSKLGTSNSFSASPRGQASASKSDVVKNMTSHPVSLTGKSLLDDIFASATLPAASASEPPNSIGIQPSKILSPQPSIGTSGPQILNAQVLSNILTGSTPSRASSVVSHPSSREGDNEDDSHSDSPSTVLDDDSDFQKQPPHSSLKVARVAGTGLLNTFGPRPINGDVTPRPPWNGLHRTSSVNEASSLMGTTSSSTPPCPMADARQNPDLHRPLVPFESDSELWPYSQKFEENSATDDDGDIVELNFEETSVLSDPEAFTRVLKQRKSAIALREAGAVNAASRGNGNPCVSVEKGKGKNRRKTKKERDAKEREEIEKGWDLPPSTPAPMGVSMGQVLGNNRALTLPSPTVVTEKSLSAVENNTPTMTTSLTLAGHDTSSSIASKAKHKVPNGHSKVNGSASIFDHEAVKDSIIHAFEVQTRPVSPMNKKEFMREVVTLIHVIASFIVMMWI